MFHLKMNLLRALWLQKKAKKHLPCSDSSPSRMTGDVKVIVTTTLGSVVVTIFIAASSYATLISYFSSVTFCQVKKKIIENF